MLPQRRRDWPEAFAAEAVVAAEAERIDVRAVAHQQVDHLDLAHLARLARLDGVVQRAAPERIAAIRQIRRLAEQAFGGVEIADGSRVVDRVLGAGRRGNALQLVAQAAGDRVVAPVERRLQQRLLAVVGQSEDAGAALEQQAHGLDVAFAHREVQRRRVPVLGRDEAGVAVE